MPSNVIYTADGVLLDHPAGNWYLLDEKAMGTNLERYSQDSTIPGRDGVLPYYDENIGPTMYGMHFVCNAVGARTVNDSYQALMALLDKRTGPVVLTRQLFGATVSADAKFVKSTDTQPIATYDSIEFIVVMEIPAGWWRDSADLTFTQSAPVSGTAYRVSTFDNTCGDIRDAKIKLTGPMTAPVFRDMGSGMEITLGTIASGRQVIVDCATGYAWEAAASSSWSLSGNDWTQYLRSTGPGSGRRVMSFAPVMQGTDPFDRRVNVRLTSTGMTASSKIEILGRRCFV